MDLWPIYYEKGGSPNSRARSFLIVRWDRTMNWLYSFRPARKVPTSLLHVLVVVASPGAHGAFNEVLHSEDAFLGYGADDEGDDHG